MNWQKRKLLVLLGVVFSTSLGAGLVSFLEKRETVFLPGPLNSGGSILSRTRTEELDFLPTEPNQEISNRKIFVKTTQTVELSQISLEEEAKSRASQLAEVLEKNDLPLVYDFLGEDGKSLFEKDDFAQGPLSFPKIVQAEIIGGPEVIGEWSECIIRVILEDRSEKKYFAVFHLEYREWKLFGTQEIFP